VFQWKSFQAMTNTWWLTFRTTLYVLWDRISVPDSWVKVHLFNCSATDLRTVLYICEALCCVQKCYVPSELLISEEEAEKLEEMSSEEEEIVEKTTEVSHPLWWLILLLLLLLLLLPMLCYVMLCHVMLCYVVYGVVMFARSNRKITVTSVLMKRVLCWRERSSVGDRRMSVLMTGRTVTLARSSV